MFPASLKRRGREIPYVLFFGLKRGTKDTEITEKSIAEVFNGVGISNGVTVYINEGQNDDEILERTARALGLENTELMFLLNACKVYKIS